MISLTYETEAASDYNLTLKGEIFDYGDRIKVGSFFVLYRGKTDITDTFRSAELSELAAEFVRWYRVDCADEREAMRGAV